MHSCIQSVIQSMSLSDLLAALPARPLARPAVGVVLVAGCLWVSFRFLEPIPPRKIVLASGPASSLYHLHAQSYKEALAREGVTLEERMTDGAGDNLRLLLDRNSGVDIGFVEGGVARFPEANSVVRSLSGQYTPVHGRCPSHRQPPRHACHNERALAACRRRPLAGCRTSASRAASAARGRSASCAAGRPRVWRPRRP